MPSSFITNIYNASVGLFNVRYRQEPTGAAGIAIADDAAWDQIIAGAVLAASDPHWLAGLNIGEAAATAADAEEVVAEGIGGVDGAAIAAATLLAEVDVNVGFATAAGLAWEPPVFFPVPMRCGLQIVANGTRHAARISTSAVGGVAITLGITYITGLAG